MSPEPQSNLRWTYLAIGELRADVRQLKRDVRALQRKPPRDPVQLKELMPWAMAMAALIAVIAGKMTIAEAVSAGLLGR